MCFKRVLIWYYKSVYVEISLKTYLKFSVIKIILSSIVTLNWCSADCYFIINNISFDVDTLIIYTVRVVIKVIK